MHHILKLSILTGYTFLALDHYMSTTILSPHNLDTALMHYAPKIDLFLTQINTLILDKPQQTTWSLCCLFAGGHVLFEDLPGLGKTTLSHALSYLAGLKFQRIQFTNDMLASDIIGFNLFNQKEHQFEFKQGPIFSQILLADEINRSSPKTQSALLEAMEEGFVTVDAVRYALPKPFWVIATQNPFSQSGTYALPESQLDRFLMCLSLGYPSPHAEKLLLKQQSRRTLFQTLTPVFNTEDILTIQHYTQHVHCSEAILDYLVRLANETRKGHHGLSTRGLLALKRAAQSYAFIQKRAFVLPEDIQTIFSAVVAHRIQLSKPETDLILNRVAVEP